MSLTRDPRYAKRYCPRCGVGYSPDGLCSCGLKAQRPVRHLYHFAPRGRRGAIEDNGLCPQAISTDWGPCTRHQPTGIYVFADRFVAEAERDFITFVKGPVDLWRVNAADVHGELCLDKGFAGEAYYLTAAVPASRLS